AGDVVVRLAVVAEPLRVLEQALVPRHEHPAFAGGDGLGRVERVRARVAPAPRPASVPARPVGVGAVLEQEDPLAAPVLAEALELERDVAADVDDDGGARPALARLALEVLER